MDFLRQIVLPLILTILLELTALIALREKRKCVYFAQIGMNILTNIGLNLMIELFPFNQIEVYFIFFIGAEFIIILIEMFLYVIVTKNFKKSCLYSTCCNVFSALIGLGVGLLIAVVA